MLRLSTLACMAMIACASCKKTIHSNEPTPGNVRLLSYSKITTINTNVPVVLPARIVTESFRFYYDKDNRVSQIIHTGNDPNVINQRIDFGYDQDKVYRSVTDVVTSMVVERDTIIKNSLGQVVTAYMPGIGGSGMKYSFEYHGKLLSRVNREATNWHTITMSAGAIYTSVNGDLLKQNADGTLKVAFSNVTTPLDMSWNQNFEVINNVPGYSSSTYTATPYAKNAYVFIKDAANDTSSLTYPAWSWTNESYHFYTEDANRTGDYLQLESMILYGQNIYCNEHLVESISAADKNAYITYRMDADSKIVQASVKTSDKLLNTTDAVYDVQYEQY